MFLHVFVSLSRGGEEGVYDVTSCLVPCFFQRGDIVPGGMVPGCLGYGPGEGVWSQRGIVYPTPPVLTSSGGHRSGWYASY